MMSRTLFRLLMISRRIWVRTVLISLLAFIAAWASPVLSPVLPLKLVSEIDDESLRSLLDILSTSMLAVTTFSLTVVAATHLTASQHVTPRVHRLLREDGRMQTTLATFMGAFVYALVSIVLMNLRIHNKDDFGTVYLFTLAVIVLVIVAILRWIQHLTTLGSMDRTTYRVEDLTRESIDRRRRAPFFGGRPVPDAAAPEFSRPLLASRFGYLQHIDFRKLADRQEKKGGSLRLAAMPGDWVDAGMPLAHLSGPISDASGDELEAAFSIGEMRTFTLDPGYGLIVLSEIACRALSPGINDPRTAEDVLGRMLRLLALPPVSEPEVEMDWLEVPRRDPGDLVRLAIDPVARDGRAFFEVQEKVQRVLRALARHPDPAVAEAARDMARRAMRHAERGELLDEDLSRLTAIMPATTAAG